jgi:hypothetical protein
MLKTSYGCRRMFVMAAYVSITEEPHVHQHNQEGMVMANVLLVLFLLLLTQRFPMDRGLPIGTRI